MPTSISRRDFHEPGEQVVSTTGKSGSKSRSSIVDIPAILRPKNVGYNDLMFTLRRRRLRFGLRSLLVLLTLICLWFGYYASQATHRRQAIAHVAKLGGIIWQRQPASILNTSDSDTWWQRLASHYENFVCRVFGSELREDVVAIELTDVSVSEFDLRRLRPLNEIEWLTITGDYVDDSAAEQVQAFRCLRWLDISNSAISIDGIKKLAPLKSLEWLNVAGTRIAESDLASIQPMFHRVEIGTTTDRVSVASPPISISRIDFGDEARTLWEVFSAIPYSHDALDDYLAAIQGSSAVAFPNWYISAVYRAKRKGMNPLLVVEVYNGTSRSFSLGCLLVFAPDGSLLREIPEERVHRSLTGPMQ